MDNLTQAVADKAASIDALGSTVKFIFEDGLVYLDGSGDKNTVSNDDKEADCSINVAKEDFEDLMSGDLDSMSAFMGGKLKIDGDMGVAMKLSGLFG